MNREDVLRLAAQADEYADLLWPGEFHPDRHDMRDLHFAALIAAAEREACAEVCLDVRNNTITEVWSVGARVCAEAIWQRGKA